MENDFTANDHPTKVVEVEDTGFYANDHPYKVVNVGGSSGIKAKVVDELPETGEDGVIYLILKEETREGDIYDEWIWVEESGGEYAWEHLGATNEVTIQLYDATGANTDGAMTQKAATNMLYPEGEETLKRKLVIPILGNGAFWGLKIGGRANSTLSGGSIVIGRNAGVENTGGSVLIGDNTFTGPYSSNVAIGKSASAGGYYNIAIGDGATVPNVTTNLDCVALGRGTRVTNGRANVVSIGSGNSSHSYGTRYLENVKDPELPQDAATKNYVDTHGATALSDTDFNNLWSNA